MKNGMYTAVNAIGSVINCWKSTVVFGDITLKQDRYCIETFNTISIMRKAEKAFLIGEKQSPRSSVLNYDREILSVLLSHDWNSTMISAYDGGWYTSGFSCAMIKETFDDIYIIEQFTEKHLKNIEDSDFYTDTETFDNPPSIYILIIEKGSQRASLATIHKRDPRISKMSKESLDQILEYNNEEEDKKAFRSFLKEKAFMRRLKKGGE
jgi:hypothetical protein